MLVYTELFIATATLMRGTNAFYFEQTTTMAAPCTSTISACPTFPVDSNGNDIVPSQTMKCGDTITDNISNGVSSTNLPYCGTSANRGFWYRFEDAETCHDSVTFSTCDMASFDTKIIIFNDADCVGGEPECVTSRDDTTGCSGFTTELTVNAPGRFYVYMTGFNGATGTFTLTATCNVVG